jgi:hypothetical protein
MNAVFIITAASILVFMTGWFIAAQIRGRNDIADVAWGLGFILAAAVSLIAGNVNSSRGLLISALVLIWGIRLALHIHSRNRGKGEDPRYRKWREEWGKWFVLRSFLQVFILQGILLLMVAIPVIFVNQTPAAPLGWLDLADGSGTAGRSVFGYWPADHHVPYPEGLRYPDAGKAIRRTGRFPGIQEPHQRFYPAPPQRRNLTCCTPSRSTCSACRSPCCWTTSGWQK